MKIQILLKDTDPRIRAAAANSLGMIGDSVVIPLLRRVMNEDSDQDVRNSAAEALELLEGIAELEDF